MATESIAYEYALAFAKRIVNLSRHLRDEHHEFVISKQVLRSGTSIGANIAEARCSYSRKEFGSKIYIALKESAETLYWLEVLHEADYLSDREYTSLKADCDSLFRMLTATTKHLHS